MTASQAVAAAPPAPAPALAPAPAAGAEAHATEEATSVCAALRQHADCPPWLPEQLGRVQQHYAAAGPKAGLAGDALLGQRVAFALLEDFHQHDSRREVDTMLAGLHTGQYASDFPCCCETWPPTCPYFLHVLMWVLGQQDKSNKSCHMHALGHHCSV